MNRIWIVPMALALSWLATPTFSQSYPSRPIKLIVPFGAGGPVDLMGRLVAQKLSVSLGATVVENKPGQGGTIGARSVATASFATPSASACLPSVLSAGLRKRQEHWLTEGVGI
jgi:tripartite-type tricarboxylate transporter receptor subunit TctC